MKILNWLENKELRKKSLRQIVAIAGEGKLLDGNTASDEFRDLLRQVPPEVLVCFAGECLDESFEDSGLALQDVINEVGRRLGFAVEAGRYRGVQGKSGHDGLWEAGSEVQIIVEVKTTSAYTIRIGKVAEYRDQLVKSGRVSAGTSSILMVVGRQDTSELEAQIRGSKQAWDIRLISVDALLRLMLLKVRLDDPQILRKITGVLCPQEFTKVDGIIDLVFSTAEDAGREEAYATTAGGEAGVDQEQGERAVAGYHDKCVEKVQSELGKVFVKRTRTIYETPDGQTVIWVAASKEHLFSGGHFYWYAFHPYQKEALQKAKDAFVVLGCGSPDQVLLLPGGEFLALLDNLWITESPDRMYWHVKLQKQNGRILLLCKKGHGKTDLSRFLLADKKRKATSS